MYFLRFVRVGTSFSCTGVLKVQADYYVNRQIGCKGAIACRNSGETEEVVDLASVTYGLNSCGIVVPVLSYMRLPTTVNTLNKLGIK